MVRYYNLQYRTIMNHDDFNPAIRPLLTRLIDDLINLPISLNLVELHQKNPFLSLKKKLQTNTPMSLDQFHSSLEFIFTKAESRNDEMASIACQILRKKVDKKLDYIQKVNQFRFKDVLIEACEKAFPDIDFHQMVADDESTVEPPTRNASKHDVTSCSKRPSAKMSHAVEYIQKNRKQATQKNQEANAMDPDDFDESSESSGEDGEFQVDGKYESD
ncbi:hypothetical protein TRFO_32667 [Tritrichomonas foetus]|uniref:Uncharacterized protein n=1 Tax=Tritrichomonas foetus TaxID=1144522 RepID=A0A1J4JQF0_9EUKA|nr:hypothetical protein TRFO_32667 [Tritrichomonas foetus]|eukprot:OHT00640.1 hypothetical protein TRFO_32667 [Tritrichomonas foetus]